jgi:hypothetical protein
MAWLPSLNIAYQFKELRFSGEKTPFLSVVFSEMLALKA